MQKSKGKIQKHVRLFSSLGGPAIQVLGWPRQDLQKCRKCRKCRKHIEKRPKAISEMQKSYGTAAKTVSALLATWRAGNPSAWVASPRPSEMQKRLKVQKINEKRPLKYRNPLPKCRKPFRLFSLHGWPAIQVFAWPRQDLQKCRKCRKCREHIEN